MKKILAVEAKLLLRDWPGVAFSIGLPVGLLLILGQIPDLSKPDPAFGGQRFIDAQLPAQMILLALLTISFTVLPSVLTTYRERGVLRRMSTTPVPPARLLGCCSSHAQWRGNSVTSRLTTPSLGLPGPRTGAGAARSSTSSSDPRRSKST